MRNLTQKCLDLPGADNVSPPYNIRTAEGYFTYVPAQSFYW